MGGFFGVASKNDCVLELFYGVDYHSHLGTRRGGMATHGKAGFNRAIHNIENAPFRTKFTSESQTMHGTMASLHLRLRGAAICALAARHLCHHDGRQINNAERS